MAARRLIIVMLVLLGISTALAVIVPDPRERDRREESDSTTGATGATGTTGSTGDDQDVPGLGAADARPRTVESTIEPDSKDRSIRAGAGDRLILSVQTKVPAVVEIPALGLTGTTSAFAPAVFDVILPEKPEKIQVTSGDEEPIATIDTGN